MQITGIIADIQEVEQVTDNFSKRVLVVQTQEQYPQELAVEFINNNVNLLNNLGVGETVEVDVNIRGRKWTNPKDGKDVYFTTLNGWRIKSLTESAAPSVPTTAPAPTQPPVASAQAQAAPEDDDLPF